MISLKLLSRQPLSPKVEQLTLQVGPGPGVLRPQVWLAGQYIELMFDAQGCFRVPYSIASAPNPDQPGVLELAVSRGAVPQIDQLVPGTVLQAGGPFGNLTWQGRQEQRGIVLLVGMGTGVSPLRALVQDELQRSEGYQLVLLCGQRTEADLLWREEFDALATNIPRFRFEPTLSQPGEGWAGRRGRVQNHVAALAKNIGPIGVYVCGKRKMVGEVVRIVSELGIATEQIRSESY